jgi:hypothetical protein
MSGQSPLSRGLTFSAEEFEDMARRIEEDFAKAPEGWGFAEKLWKVSGEAFRCWAMMTAYSAAQFTDGYVSSFNATRQCSLTPALAEELAKAGLLDIADGGYTIRSHDGEPWERWQYTSTERDEDRKKAATAGAKGGAAKAAKAQPLASKVSTATNSAGYNHEEAFTSCWDVALGIPNRGDNKKAAHAAFMDKIPDQAASNLLFEKLKLMKAETSASWGGGWSFVKFVDGVYQDWQPKLQKALPVTVAVGSHKVTESTNTAEHYGAPGQQEI